jgi:hypothetical protein
MEAKVTPEELDGLRRLDTDSLQKPELPPAMAERLVQQGLAIRLVEGGLQLTALGREYLLESKTPEK